MQISILGCGWLGFPLAKSLQKKGFIINGSTTTEEKISSLKNEGIHPFKINLFENKIDGDFNLFIENSEILIVDIPPKLRGTSTENFVRKIENLVPLIENSGLKKVLFVSSTSVYADNNSIYTEENKPNPTTEAGKQLVEVELLLQKNIHFKTTIVRFGGLIGKDRHPISFLAGRTNIENPEGVLNLIHQEDCIGIIEKIVELDVWNQIFNAVTPFHPTRKTYYLQKATELELALPTFDESKPSVGKWINSSKIESLLGYTFKTTL